MTSRNEQHAKTSAKRVARRRPRAARRVTLMSPIGRIVFQRSGKWWAVELPSIPSAYTQGRTRDEAYRNLISLLRDLIEASESRPPKFTPVASNA
jgi:predicted RNase H-like HicB family nuclease